MSLNEFIPVELKDLVKTINMTHAQKHKDDFAPSVQKEEQTENLKTHIEQSKPQESTSADSGQEVPGPDSPSGRGLWNTKIRYEV